MNFENFVQRTIKAQVSSEHKQVLDIVFNNNAYVAGGYARYLAYPDLNTNDIDIVLQDKNVYALFNIQDALQNIGYEYLHTSFFAATFTHPKIEYPTVQVLINRNGVPSKVLSEFTLLNEMFFVSSLDHVQGYEASFKAVDGRIIERNPLFLSLETFGRVAKYARKVYEETFYSNDPQNALPVSTLPLPVYSVPAKLIIELNDYLVANNFCEDYTESSLLLNNLLYSHDKYADACEHLGIYPEY